MKKVSLQASSSSTDRVLVGRIGRPHGLAGYVVVHPETDNPERFRAGATVHDATGTPFEVERSQPRGEGLLIRFVGVADRTAAEQIAGTELFIPDDQRRDLEEGEYWPDELIGLTVRSHDGRSVGIVVGVVEGAAQVRLDVESEHGRFEVPFVAALVPDVDLAGRVITLANVPGLVPGN